MGLNGAKRVLSIQCVCPYINCVVVQAPDWINAAQMVCTCTPPCSGTSPLTTHLCPPTVDYRLPILSELTLNLGCSNRRHGIGPLLLTRLRTITREKRVHYAETGTQRFSLPNGHFPSRQFLARPTPARLAAREYFLHVIWPVHYLTCCLQPHRVGSTWWQLVGVGSP